MRGWRAAKLSPGDSLLTAIGVIDRTQFGIALIVDDHERLLGVVVDGDIRRAVLRGLGMEIPVRTVMKTSPVTAQDGQTSEVYLALMLSKNIQQLPLIGQSGKLVGLELLKDLQSELASGFKAVIMAGGLGTRMRPLTDANPKPLLPVGNRPIMEHVIERLRESGIREVVVSTHYKGDLIQKHFGDGSACGIAIKYVEEEHRFGTIGSLRLMRDQLKKPFLVVNGDILTTLDFSTMHNFHQLSKADMTVAVRKHALDVPYGVVKVEGESVVGFEEKPSLPVLINAGIYLINPEMIEYIPDNQPFDASDLIEALLKKERHVAAFPIIEYWMDVGYPTDYEKANADLSAGRMGQGPQ